MARDFVPQSQGYRTPNKENAFREDLSVVVNFASDVAGSQERL